MIMNNKTIKIAIIALAASFSFSSCLFEEDDVFDESAALRGQHYTQSVEEVLYTPENGWVLQYFPNSAPYFETQEIKNVSAFTTIYQKGYNIFVRFFKNQTCIMTSNHEYIRENITMKTPGAMRSDTSLFCINEQDGPVLSFNTWNDILSVFTDPVSPISVKSGNFVNKDGQGLRGDNEFVILSVSKDMILMRGLRHDARVRLIKADRPQADYIAAVQAIEKTFVSGPVQEYLVISQNQNLCDTLYAYDMSEGLVTFAPNQGEEWINTEGLAFVCGTDGFHFQFPESFSFYHINGPGDTIKWSSTIQDFAFNEDHSAFVSDNKEVVFAPHWEQYALNQVNKNRTVTFEQTEGDETWQKICADLNSAIKGAYSTHSLLTLTFGTSSESGNNRRTGLVFQTTKTVFAGITASASVNQNVITFAISDTSDKKNYSSSLSTYINKNLGDYFFAVANYLNGSWKMTCDNTFAPSKVTLTSTEDANKVIVLSIK